MTPVIQSRCVFSPVSHFADKVEITRCKTATSEITCFFIYSKCPYFETENLQNEHKLDDKMAASD